MFRQVEDFARSPELECWVWTRVRSILEGKSSKVAAAMRLEEVRTMLAEQVREWTEEWVESRAEPGSTGVRPSTAVVWRGDTLPAWIRIG